MEIGRGRPLLPRYNNVTSRRDVVFADRRKSKWNWNPSGKEDYLSRDPFTFILPQNLKGTSADHFFSFCRNAFPKRFDSLVGVFIFPAKGSESGIFTAFVAQDSAACERLLLLLLRSRPAGNPCALRDQTGRLRVGVDRIISGILEWIQLYFVEF